MKKQRKSFAMRALLQLSSRQFERLVRDFYKAEGYGATLTRKGPDGGYDVRFYDTESKTMHIVECKRYSGYVNEEIIEKLDAVVRKKRDNYLRDGVRIQGILVTIGTISDEVSRIARGRGIKSHGWAEIDLEIEAYRPGKNI